MKLTTTSTMRDIHDYCMQNGLFSLSQGMIEIPPPEKLINRVTEAINTNPEIHMYRKRYGEEDYLKALQFMLENVYDTKVAINELLATAGVTGGVVATLCYLKKILPNTKKVGLIEPFYTYHLKDIHIYFPSDRVIFIPCRPDYTLDLDIVEEYFKSNDIGVLLLCNPCNPSGLIVPQEKLDKLVELCRNYGSYLILDEVYADFVFSEKARFYSPVQNPNGIPENVIAVRGFTKCLGTQSWRLGYLIACSKLVAGIMAEHDPIYISLSWLQHAMAKYLTEDIEDYKRHCELIRETMQKNWQAMYPAFQKRFGWEPIHPDGSMYGCFKHTSPTDMDAVLAAVDAGVGVAPGVIFFRPGGNPNTGMIRIHCGISHDKAQRIAQKLLENI